jgi:hypothetical protein
MAVLLRDAELLWAQTLHLGCPFYFYRVIGLVYNHPIHPSDADMIGSVPPAQDINTLSLLQREFA